MIISASIPKLALSEEHQLRLLVWEGYAPAAYIKKFETHVRKKFNLEIKTVVSTVSSADGFFAPVRGKEADIITPTYHMFEDERWGLKDRQLILPLHLDNIPNFKNITPSIRKAQYLQHDGEIYAVPIAHGPYGLTYNTHRVKTAPDSWNILWNPKYKGKYVIAESEYMRNCMITALALGYPRHTIHKYDKLNNPIFREKLAQLANNAHSFWVGVDKVDDLLGHSLGTSWGFALSGLKDKGEIWKFANPHEGTIYWVDNFAITWAVKDKPILRTIAEEWCNFVLSPDYQVEVVMRRLSSYPVTTNIRERVTKDEIIQFRLDAPAEYQKTRIIQSNLSLRDRNGLKKLWDGAIKGRGL